MVKMFRVYTVSVIILGVITECMSVTVLSVPHGKVIYRRKQGYDYGGDFKPLQLEYKGYYNPPAQQKPAFQDAAKQNFQQQFNNLYQQQLNYQDGQFKQQEPLALFVSKPEEQNFLKQPTKSLFENILVKQPQNDKALEWESFKVDNNAGQLKQDFQPVLQKPPQTQSNNYNFQQSANNDHNQFPLYPPTNEFYPGLKQPQQPVNLYVGFDEFKQNAIQQPAEAAKQNFNAFNLPKLQQQQKQEGLSVPSVNYNLYGGHLLEPGKGQQLQHFEQQELIGQNAFKNTIHPISNNIDNNNQQQHQGNGALFAQIFNNNNQGIANEFKTPNEQNMLKFSNEDAVEPQEVGKVVFGKGVNFDNNAGFGGANNIKEGKRGNGKKKRSKRLRSTREPKYTYIIRARRHRD